MPPVSDHPLIECRVPTYRRPDLLRRALTSLQAQTEPRWQAIVLDDSPAAEAREVVARLGDERIHYRLNSEPLLASGNIDQAFAPTPFFEAQAAFVLEDDNAVAPDFIATVCKRFANGVGPVLSVNQRSVRLDSALCEKPLGVLRPHQTADQLWDFERLCLHAFTTRSLPNGGYVWLLGAGIDLSVGQAVREPQLQECIRQTRVRSVTLVPEVLSVWSLV